MKIHEVFENKVNSLKEDNRVEGIFITGSLARGTETEYSDLDIIVLYDQDKVVEEVIEGIPVETHYNQISAVKERLIKEPSSAYLYVYGKIVSDEKGELKDIVGFAKEVLANYEVSKEKKEHLKHKMQALKEKLTASLSLSDELKTSYLVANNFKYIVDAVYAQNVLPTPPQGLNYEIYNLLKIKPVDKWMERLLTLKGNELASFTLDLIESLSLD
jgi:predicted nucleotidyltransferase